MTTGPLPPGIVVSDPIAEAARGFLGSMLDGGAPATAKTVTAAYQLAHEFYAQGLMSGNITLMTPAAKASAESTKE